MPGTVSRTITVRPRVQFDRFSLYWKESMATKTQILPDVVLEKLPSENVHDLIDYLLSTHLQYPTLEDLSKCRLEGFQGPWVRVLQSGKLVYSSNGKEEASGMPLAELNLDEPLVVVMQVLVAEGWRLRVPESQDMWSDSEEEEGGWH